MSAPEPQRQRLPNLVLAGVTKAGTTSLYSYLRQSRSFFCPADKEVNFYSELVYEDVERSLDEYAKHYETAADQRWLLDASPFYFTGARRISHRIVRDLDNPRVLISLRDPVRRLWSAYTYQRSQGRSDVTSFSDFFDVCVGEFNSGEDQAPGHHESLELRTGRYMDYLPQWFDTVGPENVRVTFMESLAADPVAVLKQLFVWLDVPDVPDQVDTEARNVTSQPRSAALKSAAMWANNRFRRSLERRPGLYDAVRSMYRKLDSLNVKQLDEDFEQADQQRVRQFYGESTAELGDYLASAGYTDVPGWVRGDAGR